MGALRIGVVLCVAGTVFVAGCASGSGGAAGAASGSSDRAAAQDTALTLARPVAAYGDTVVRTQVRETAIEGLVEYSLSDSALLRANAIEAMSDAPRRAEGIVLVGLTDSNPGVRFSAAMVAGRLEMTDSASLVRPLLGDRDRRVRYAAIYALQAMGEPVDQTPLADAMRDPNPAYRATAAFVLGEIGDPGAIPVLTEFATVPLPQSVLRQRPTAPTILRLQVAEALLKLGHEDVRGVVHAALYPRDREGFEAAALAAQILGDVGDATAIAQLVSIVERTAPGEEGSEDEPPTIDPREMVFLNPPELRLAAATALARMGEVDGVYVADQYVTHPSDAVRAQSAFLYGAAGREIDLAKLEAMLGDPSPLVRLSAMAGIVTVTGS